jgi:equilibrative nucleoside transporter 1/2/3
MERIRALFTAPKKGSEEEYEPLTDDSATIEGSTYTVDEEDGEEVPFSWLEYYAFLMLGVAMLWSW